MQVNVRMIATYAILIVAVMGLLGLLFVGKGTEDQVWAAIMLILGALVRDLASIQSVASTGQIAENAIITETIRQDQGAATGPTS